MQMTRLDKQSGGIRVSGLEFYSLSDYHKLLVRRKWVIVTITLIVACTVAFIVYRTPGQYEAKTTIMVDPGKVPESYVKSTATIDANQRLSLLQAEILSTTRLSQVIDELHLYQSAKTTSGRDEIVARMRKDIAVTPVTLQVASKELQAFDISYISQSSVLAAQVADRLASLFIEENLNVRRQQVMGTVDFFNHELETAKSDLSEKSQKLAALRAQDFAELPESQAWHTQALTSLQLEMRSEMDAIGSAQQQRLYLESMLAETPTVVNLDNSSGDTAGLEEQLEGLQQEMDQLRQRYGPRYPDVLTKAAEMEKVQEKLKEFIANNKTGQPVTSGNRKHHNPVIESQIAQLDSDIKERQSREVKLKSEIAYHESILERAPAIEQELASATNDYNDAADRFKRLEDHKFAADISSDVENRQKGERFFVLETAQPPVHPSAPNRPLLDILGLSGGLFLGLFAVVVLEVFDGTVKTERELSERLNVTLLGEIPWRKTRIGNKRSRITSAVAAGGNLVLAVAYGGLLTLALR
jgi:polysaccharide biosynthesis transport protein